MAVSTALTHLGGGDVVMLRWPEQRDEAERLAEIEIPVLLLVEAGADPPVSHTCLEDWVRLPIDERDLRARIAALTHRAAAHPPAPAIDTHGLVTFRGRRVFLPPSDARVAEILLAFFDDAVPEERLVDEVSADESAAGRLRVHISRLRKRLAPLGLEITAIRGFGYRLHATIPASAP
jgi:two-component system OmpR family response regulator